MPKQTQTMIEQFTVTIARDLAIRMVETFHHGPDAEKGAARRAYVNMVNEFFHTGVQPVEQCKLLLKSVLDGLEHGSWPEDTVSVGQANSSNGQKAQAQPLA